jgi:sugar/nucleoside kinase (ribokinase family)
MKKEIDVFTFGDLCVDFIMKGKDVVPEFGQKEKLVDDYSLEMGGSCSIFACQAAKLGLKTAVVGHVGEDAFGDLILSTLENSGVNTGHVKRDKLEKTGITMMLSTGEDRAMMTYNGTIDAVSREDVTEEFLKSVKHLHIGSYFLMKRIQPHYPEIVKKLKEYGATISLDTNWDPEETWDSGIWDIMPYVDIFFPNENEAMAITKEPTAEKAIEKLKQTVPVIAVKKGADGAVIYAKGKTYYTLAVDAVKVDAVGAGDSFDGGFIYGYLSGKSIEDCARFGSICGSLNIRKAGGTKGQPKLEEALKYLDFDVKVI